MERGIGFSSLAQLLAHSQDTQMFVLVMKMVISAHLLALTPLVLKTYDVSGTKLYVDKEMENHGFYTTVWCSGYQVSF